MASDHPVVRLGDYVDACLGKMLDAQKNRGKLQPYLGNSNVRWGSFVLEDLAVMRFEDHEDERYGIRDGDLIVCEGGEPGRCAIWRGDAPMKIQKALHRVRTMEGLDNYFLYYWFLLAGSAGELEPFFTGTTIKHLTGKALAELRIPLPPIALQREVAKILSSLDAKIDLNRRINQTLEAMAQALFKSWFVDFDPVKAKIAALTEGRDPLRAAMTAISGKSDAELDALPAEHYEQIATTAALFPDEMDTSRFGDMPKGWRAGVMTDCIDVNPVRTLKKGTVAPYLDMANVPMNSARVQNVIPREFTSGSKFRNGDTLLARITPCLENGKTAFVDFLDDEAVGWGSTEFIVLRTKNGLPEPFAYFLCRDPDFRAFAIAQMAGTSGRQRVPNDCFGDYRLVEPAAEVASVFGCIAFSALNQIKALDDEARTLASLRDTLLPKLLSGELSVAEAVAEANA